MVPCTNEGRSSEAVEGNERDLSEGNGSASLARLVPRKKGRRKYTHKKKNYPLLYGPECKTAASAVALTLTILCL